MRLVRSIAVAVAVLTPAAAHAAMTYVPDTGTVARSRGGAFTAAADDPMAIVYNPAGFADQKKMQVYIDVTALQLNSSFQRASDANGSYKKVTNSGDTKVSPNLIFSQPVGDKLVWHIGAYGAMGVNMKYPETGPQRYTTTYLSPQQLSYSAGVAYRFTPMIAAGFTLGGMYITNETEVRVMPVTAGEPPSEDPTRELHAVLSVSNPFTPTGNLGVKFTPMAGLEFGLSYRPPAVAKLDGTYKASYVDSGNEAANEKVTLVVPLPQIIRTGVRKVGTGWDAELDFVVEDWTGRDKDVIDPKDGQIGAFEKINVDRDGKMAFSVRLGGSYKLMDNLAIHSGVLHETSGIPQERMSVNLFDGPKTGLGLGTSYGIGERFTVSGNLAYLMVHSVDMKDSKVRQRSSFTTDPASLNTVGNGKYQGAYMFGGVSFNTKF
jgi:long-chain fatty acid transport protein